MNGENNNKFYPKEKIFKIFKESELIPKDKYINYQNTINIIPKEDLIKSKQYLGHKLFCYINLYIGGNKFLKNEEKIKEVNKKILLWMLKNKIIEEVIIFDSFFIFNYEKIFVEEKNINIIKNL